MRSRWGSVAALAVMAYGHAVQAAPASTRSGVAKPAWSLSAERDRLTFGASALDPDAEWSCGSGDGALLLKLRVGYPPPGNHPSGRLTDFHFTAPIASGPIANTYVFHQIWDGRADTLTDRADVALAVDDPLPREFSRSGRLLAWEKIDASSERERAMIRAFFDRCRRNAADGRERRSRVPEILAADGSKLDLFPYGRKSPDGDFAYPFTPKVLVALPFAVAGAGLSGLLGRRAAGVVLGAVIVAAAVFAYSTAGPFAVDAGDAWVWRFNGIYVPVASAFGQLALGWLILGGAAAAIGLLARGLARRLRRSA